MPGLREGELMTTYLHHITMNNGDTFDLYYVDRILKRERLTEERWISYRDGRGNLRYINIAQISDIYVMEMRPVEKEVI